MKKRKKKDNFIEYLIGFAPIFLLCLFIINVILLIYNPGTSSFIEPNEHKYDNYKPLPTMPVEELKEHLNLYVYKTVDGELLTEYIDDLEYNKVYRVTCAKKCTYSTFKVPFNLSSKYIVVSEGTNTNIYDYINNKIVGSFLNTNALFVEENLVLERNNFYALYSLESSKYISEFIYDNIKINPYYNDERNINVFTSYLVASKNSKYGLVNTKNGYEATDFIYDDISCFKTSNYEYCKCKNKNTYDVYMYNRFTTSIIKLKNAYKEIYPIINNKYAYAIIGNKLVLVNLPVESIITDFGVIDYNNTILYTSINDGNPYIRFKKEVGRNTECIEYMYNLTDKSKKTSTVECN